MSHQAFTAITDDSRQVVPGGVFVAIKGSKQNGERFIGEAVKKGAKLIITSRLLELPYAVDMVVEPNVRLAFSKMAKAIYPKQPKNMVGITGTNGKTSTAYFYQQILERLGNQAAAIGTLGVIANNYQTHIELANLTSLQPGQLHALLDDMATHNITHAAMEVSSHALVQHRADQVIFQAVGYTNLTQDHLDYHETMEKYLAAKLRLFSECNYNIAVINHDDIYHIEFMNAARKLNKKVITYGKNNADITFEINDDNLVLNYQGKAYPTQLHHWPEPQIYNIIAAVGLTIASDYSIEKIVPCLNKLLPPPGRLEKIQHDRYNIFIDYAHTPDALEKVLSSLRKQLIGRLIVLFGCGGDRDNSKRPIMGEVASRLADVVIITDDNPRTENAAEIRKQIISNMQNNYIEIAGRKNAIAHAISLLQAQDILLLAGKGHEQYQIIGTEQFPFSDAATVKEILNISC